MRLLGAIFYIKSLLLFIDKLISLVKEFKIKKGCSILRQP